MPPLKNKYVQDPVFSGTCFLTALGIIHIYALTLLLTSLTFILGGHLTMIHLPLAISIALFANYLVARSWLDQHIAWTVFVRTNLIIVGILLASILLVIPFYDITIDGQWYHEEAVIQMARGWNPFKHNFPDDTINNGSLWFNHYAKGLETFQSSIYILTGKIESAKAPVLFIATGSFFLSLYFIYGLKIFSKLKAAFVSGLLVLSPWVIVQSLTFCNDGQLSSMLLYSLVTCCLIFREYKKYLLILLCAVMIITINIKFTGILYIACFTGVLLIVVLIRKKAAFRPVLLTVLLSGTTGIVLIGFNPYVTNFVNNGHPFWPLMGKNKVDIMTMEYPTSWRYMNRFHKLYLALFAHTDDMNLLQNPDQEVALKIPLTFNKTDIHNSVNPVVLMAGFGPLFSGILILSCILFLWTIIKPYPPEKRFYLLVVLATLTGTILMMEEAWDFRYVPQFWFIPIVITVASEFSPVKRMRYLRNTIYLLIAANLCFSFLSIPWNYVQTAQIKSQLREMKENGGVIPVDFDIELSNRIKFSENNIPYTVVKWRTRPDSSRVQALNQSFVKYFLPGK